RAEGRGQVGESGAKAEHLPLGQNSKSQASSFGEALSSKPQASSQSESTKHQAPTPINSDRSREDREQASKETPNTKLQTSCAENAESPAAGQSTQIQKPSSRETPNNKQQAPVLDVRARTGGARAGEWLSEWVEWIAALLSWRPRAARKAPGEIR